MSFRKIIAGKTHIESKLISQSDTVNNISINLESSQSEIEGLDKALSFGTIYSKVPMMIGGSRSFNNSARYSYDGITWYYGNTDGYVSDLGFSVAKGNNGFVMTSSIINSSEYMFSEDGVNWKEYDFPANGAYNVAYGNGVYVAVAGNAAMYSTNPITVLYSNDGMTWTLSSITTPETYRSIPEVMFHESSQRFVLNTDTSETGVYVSSDGANWTYKDHTNIGSVNNAVFATNGAMIFMISRFSGRIYYSGNVEAWYYSSNMDIPNNDYISDVKVIDNGSSRFILAITNTGLYKYSLDGLFDFTEGTWESLPAPTSWMRTIEYCFEKIFLFSDNGIYTSTDGENWLLVNDDYDTSRFTSVVFTEVESFRDIIGESQK